MALAPYRPAAGALTPDIVGEKDLAAANSIFSALENLVVVVGPGIGGLLLLTGQPVIAVAINAASFAIAAAMIARLRVRSTGGAAEDGNALQQWAAGLKALGAQPVALAIILFCALDSAVYGASTVLYVPLSVRLGTGPNGYSYLLAGAALGGGARRRPGEPAERCLPPGAGHHGQHLPAGAAVPGDGPGPTRQRWPAPCRLSPASGWSSWTCSRITSLQRDLPGDVLSRVLGVFETLVLGGILLASLPPASCSHTPMSTSR